MELIDTHCHFTFRQLRRQLDAVLARSIEAGVRSWITVGTTLDDSRAAVELARQHENLYAAVGIHPHDADWAGPEQFEQLAELAVDKKVVAIGETGLDFHYDHSSRAGQVRAFAQHLDLAWRTGKPVIIHSREAFEQTMEVLDDCASPLPHGVFHCFGGSAEQARYVVEKGFFFVSFTGVVTFKNASKAREAAAAVPLERLMVETDCPFMSPEPMRKQKVNEPALMVHTARCLADAKQTEPEALAAALTRNSRSFFNLPGG
jgi:TatD DNase family protein